MLHRKMTDNLMGHWPLLCGSKPNSEHCFGTENVQIFFNTTEQSWPDPAEHYHTESDEIYIVLDGAMNIEVEGKLVCVGAGEFLCVPKFEKHQLKSVVVPHKSLVIRGPSVQDKITTA